MRPDALDATFAALADPTRRAMLVRLAQGELPVKSLAAPFAMSGPAITKHLKVLERAGLVTRSREGRQRPCRLEAAPLADASHWIEQYRRLWDARLDRLGDYLRALKADQAGAARSPRPARRTHSATSSAARKAGRKELRHGRSRRKPRG